MSDSVIHAVAGGLAGMLAMTLTYPFVFISTRAAVETKNHNKQTSYEAILAVIKRDGLSGIYTGLNSSLLGIAVTNSVYYYFYERARGIVQKGKALSTPESMLIGLIAGSATSILSNPLWVIQTSQTVETMDRAEPSLDPSDSKVVKKLSILQTARKLLAQEGIGAFWRGIGPALVLVINPILQYTLFEQLKNTLIARRTAKLRAAGLSAAVAALSDGDIFLLGALAKLVATTTTYPYIVIKSRLQAGVGSKYKSSLDGLATILRDERVEGLSASGAVPPFPPIRLAEKNLKLLRPTVGNYLVTPQEIHHYSTELFSLLAADKLNIQIHKEYPFNREA
ncbi:mitochondrial carrier [Mycena amicta]|nr:mitochondrial carrier [Mycena amicta]